MGHYIEAIFHDVVVLTILIILVAITAGFSASAARKITKIDDWDDNDNLQDAHKQLSWAASIGFIYIGILILVAILIIILYEVLFELTKIIFTIIIIITIAVLIIIGILAAEGASNINKANVSDDMNSYTDALIATFASIGSVVLVILYLVGRWIYKEYEKRRQRKLEQNKQEKEIELAEGVVKSKNQGK